MMEKRAQVNDMISLTDFPFFFCEEKKKENGEDSFVYALQEAAALVGVFDGCGGAGAAKYAALDNKTGAYLASRATAAAYLHWFEELAEDAEPDLRALKERILQYLRLCEKQTGQEESKLMGSISKKLPTTAAVVLCRPGRGSIRVQAQWAGDSRVYLLDADGLAQLTEDDLGGIDAMQNLSRDGALTNVISLSKDFSIHTADLSMGRPGLVFAATDGCFGYLSTPMEFEYMLLRTLQESQNAMGWERAIIEAIGKVAGDDYTISGLSLGFGSFDHLKQSLAARTAMVYKTYIHGLDNCSREEKLKLWEHYQIGYHRLLTKVTDARN